MSPPRVIAMLTCSLCEPHPQCAERLGTTVVHLFAVGGHLGCLQGLYTLMCTRCGFGGLYTHHLGCVSRWVTESHPPAVGCGQSLCPHPSFPGQAPASLPSHLSRTHCLLSTWPGWGLVTLHWLWLFISLWLEEPGPCCWGQRGGDKREREASEKDRAMHHVARFLCVCVSLSSTHLHTCLQSNFLHEMVCVCDTP